MSSCIRRVPSLEQQGQASVPTRKFAIRDGEITLSRQKNKAKVFVLLSTFRNSGFAELTWHSEIKRKESFPFVFLSFFRNFAA